MDYCIVMTTFENEEQAEKIIESVLKEKLAACIQTFNIKSHYVWNNEICKESELLVWFKTQNKLYGELDKLIKRLHPYETPEIIKVDIAEGDKTYLEWMNNVTK